MIQRKQTIYLLLAAILIACLFFQPVDLLTLNPVLSQDPRSLSLFDDSIFDIYDNIIFLVLSGLSTAIIFLTIFLYRNRKLQINLGKLSILLILVLLVISVYFTFQDMQSIGSGYSIRPQIGAFLPFVSVLLLVFAVRGIKKDDKLVKSMDRLR